MANENLIRGMANIQTAREKLVLQAQAVMAAAETEGRDLTAEEDSLLHAYGEQSKDLVRRAERQQLQIELERGLPEQKTDRSGNHRGFGSLGEQLIAVQKFANSNGQLVDQRLIAAAAGMNETVPSEGGWAVQSDFSNELIANMFQVGEIASRVRRMGIGANSNGLKMLGVEDNDRSTGAISGGILAYWADEAAAVTASKPKFRQINLSLKKLMAIGYATEELLQDAVAMTSVMTSGFTEAITFKSEDSFINGTGAGQPLGILNSAGTVSVAKEAGQAADTITWENIKKMYSRMKASSMGNAIWIVNQECMIQLMGMYQVVGIGGVPVWLPPNGAAGSPFSTLMGRPVIPVEYCAAIGDTGDIMFCDFSKYLAIDKGAPQQASSMHVRFLTDEMTFRVTYRLDGQPLFDKPVTPYKGTATVSSFVKLDAR